MRTAINTDLVNASDAVEHLLEMLPKLKLAEQVDVGARLRAIIKNAEKLDDKIKDHIKAERGGKDGTVLGDSFKAVLANIPTERCDVKTLKESEPEIYADYVKHSSQQRVTFEPR